MHTIPHVPWPLSTCLFKARKPKDRHESSPPKSPLCLSKKHGICHATPGFFLIWPWVKNAYRKWNPGKWNQRLKPAVPLWFYFDPYPKKPSKKAGSSGEDLSQAAPYTENPPTAMNLTSHSTAVASAGSMSRRRLASAKGPVGTKPRSSSRELRISWYSILFFLWSILVADKQKTVPFRHFLWSITV